MPPKIAVAICTAISVLLNCSSSNADGVSDDSNIRAVSGAAEQSWYQEGAFLQVVDGLFTIQLLANDSTPKFLNAERTGVVKVNRGFATIPSLESLSLEDNMISVIEDFVFEGLPQLVHLNLARNRISFIRPNGLGGLAKLKVLNLNQNSFSSGLSFSIATNALPSLTHFYMNRNRITTIGNPSLICNSNLKHLHLSNNSLTTVNLRNSGNTTCLPNLTHLYLDMNSVRALDIDQMPLLRALILDRNRFPEIPKVNSELKFLSIARNFVSTVTNLENATNLVRLILSNNYLGNDLSFTAQFQNFSFLEHLGLQRNNIPLLPDGCFYNLPSLRNLYLHDNRIRKISPKAFAKLPALEELSFQNNQLQSLPGKELFGESNLSYLDVTNNLVENITDLEASMIPKLKVLKITGNLVKRVEPRSVPGDTAIIL